MAGALSTNIVPYYAALLSLIFIVLSVSVIRQRGRHRVALGTGGVSDIERRVRVHGNFAEYVPLSLILLAMAEWRGLPAIILHFLCLCLVAGRLLHAWGVSRPNENPRFRVTGMGLTFTALAGAAIAILLS